LVALVLGALRRLADAQGKRVPETGSTFERGTRELTRTAFSEWITRAYEWGARRGLPQDPVLCVAFLEHEHGVQCALACERALSRFAMLQIAPSTAREMLNRGTSPKTTVAIVQAALELEALASEVAGFYRVLLEQPLPRPGRRAEAKARARRSHKKPHAQPRLTLQQQMLQSRIDTMQKLSALLESGVRTAREADVVRELCVSIAFFLRPLLAIAPEVWEHLCYPATSQRSLRDKLAILFDEALKPLAPIHEMDSACQKDFLESSFYVRPGAGRPRRLLRRRRNLPRAPS
jgi:hypothetical protein